MVAAVAFSGASATPPRTRFISRWNRLRGERESWFSHWQDILRHLIPRRLVLDHESKEDQGRKKHSAIVNATGTFALRTLASGMQSGITSPSRPWFKLIVTDPALSESANVRSYLDAIEDAMRTRLLSSNIYNCLHNIYTDLGAIGTAALYIEEDEEDGVRGYVLPAGSYCLVGSSRRRVDGCYRITGFTVQQVVEKFGTDNLSAQLLERYKNGDLDGWVKVLHVVERNEKWDGMSLLAENKRYRSVWMELEAPSDFAKNLRVSGFDEFPIMAPRWNVSGDAVYGDSPGMDALGDIRALQQLERDKARAFVKIVDPPMVAPTSLATRNASLLPGAVNRIDVAAGGQTFRPAMEINPSAMGEFRQAIAEHEHRISRTLYADTWLTVTTAERTNMTATEVAQRTEEKMQQLGPVLERLQDELLDPMVDRIFNIGVAAGWFPEPPEELSGKPLRIEYISIMAQAQKAMHLTGIERLAGFAGSLLASDPEDPTVRHKLDKGKALEAYRDALGTRSDLLRSEAEVEAIIDQAAQAQQASQQGADISSMVQGAKVLSETDMGGDSALNRVLGNMGVQGQA